MRNLKHCPPTCRRTTYPNLFRSILEYGATILDPFIQDDNPKLERVQRRAVRLISDDFRSREEGCVIKMLNDTSISPLSELHRMLRLVMFNQVVEEKIPALPHQEFLTPIGIKRKIKTRSFSDNYHHQNHVGKFSSKNLNHQRHHYLDI